MPSPNAFYIGDTVYAGTRARVTIKAFVKPASGRQLVRVEWPDGTHSNRGFDTLRPLERQPAA